VEYKVKIDAFEGPLDLLLHLIKTLEIDIYDIPVSEITDQYLDFIHHMQKLELDVAGDYLVMAATLIAMKSRMLLPKPENLDDEAEEPYEDPEETKKTLVRRLLEYRQYKEAAEALRVQEETRRRLFAKAAADLTGFNGRRSMPIPREGRASVEDMIRAVRKMMYRKRMSRPLRTKIARQPMPIGKQMQAVIGMLRRIGHPVWLDDLLPSADRAYVIVTFLALLELMKENRIDCSQKTNFSNILIRLGGSAD
jgi:segregation and condensation protein A